MQVNDLTLPTQFVRDVKAGIFRREMGGWQLKDDVDSYGNFLESELGEVYENEATILKETLALPKGFELDGFYAEPIELNESKNNPGFIPDIIDFTQIVCFGISGDGAPFCFDYRENLNNPSVIWWDDVYWRRIAPNYILFKALFDYDKDQPR